MTVKEEGERGEINLPIDGLDLSTKQKTMSLEDEDDSIGQLPQDVVGNILGRLPLKEAVQTSLLSRKWRYRWCSAHGLSFIFVYNQQVDFLTFAHLVERVLDSITGTISSFRIHFLSKGVDGQHKDHDSHRTNRWLCQAVRLGATSLTVCSFFDSKLELSRDLFSCFHGLQRLDLYYCGINLPETSAGPLFPAVTTLHLNSCTFEEGGLQQLVNSCPELRLLRAFAEHGGVGNLEIVLSKLQDIAIIGLATDNISLKCCPHLKKARVDLYLRREDNNNGSIPPPQGVLHLFHDASKFIQSLELGRYTLKKLSRSYVPHKFRWQFECLKYISFDMDLGSVGEISVALCFLRSTPILDCMYISAGTEITEEGDDLYSFWNRKRSLDCSLDRLAYLSIYNFQKQYPHLEFCRFLLANTPNLKSFLVRPPIDGIDGRRNTEVKQELKSYDQIASPYVCIW